MDKTTNEYDAMRDRIFQLLDEQKISQKEFAKMIQVSPQTITDWKKRKSQSFASMTGRIAEVLSTTPIWLFSGTGNKKVSWDDIHKEDDERVQIMAAMMQQRAGTGKKELVSSFKKAVEKNNWTISDFVSPELKSFANNCNISVDELFGYTKEPTVGDDGLSDGEQALLNLFRQLTLEQQDMVIRMVQAATDKL